MILLYNIFDLLNRFIDFLIRFFIRYITILSKLLHINLLLRIAFISLLLITIKLNILLIILLILIELILLINLLILLKLIWQHLPKQFTITIIYLFIWLIK
jgi:hypothetical protein